MEENKGDWNDEFVHHWKYYRGHARASPSDLEFIKKKVLEKIEKYNGDKSKVKFLVLGSTPEYRNLCGELGITCYCFDFKKYNFDYLAEEVKNKPKEIFTQGNWLESIPAELANEKFDIILGDCIPNIIMPEDFQKLFENVFKLLKQDGFFMPRTYIKEKNEKLTSEEAIKKYREEGSKKPVYTWVGRELYVSSYKEGKDRIILKEIWDEIIRLHENNLLTKDEVDELNQMSYKNRNLFFSMPIREEFDESIKKVFDIKEIFFATEPYSKKLYPLHVCIKKK
ncbi:hypothetical protein HOC35_04915 [Candidatus Woesearchaeota archaeon]|jgi:SAM-dependent methyltransferase|nr:hypothetical protein [Candidatus Woesearchaeota archaeon]